MDYEDLVVDGDNLSVPYWQCGQCGANGEAATPQGAETAMLGHFRDTHPDVPIVLPQEHN